MLFEWHGLARTEAGTRRLTGSITHLSDDERYKRLNDVVCVIAREVRPRAAGGFDVVLEVSELVWEPLGRS